MTAASASLTAPLNTHADCFCSLGCVNARACFYHFIPQRPFYITTMLFNDGFIQTPGQLRIHSLEYIICHWHVHQRIRTCSMDLLELDQFAQSARLDQYCLDYGTGHCSYQDDFHSFQCPMQVNGMASQTTENSCKTFTQGVLLANFQLIERTVDVDHSPP